MSSFCQCGPSSRSNVRVHSTRPSHSGYPTLKVSQSDRNRWQDVDPCPVSGRSTLVQGFQYIVDFYHQKGDFPSHKDFSTLHNTKRKEYHSRQFSHMTRKYTRIHITVLQPKQQQTQPLKRHSPFSRPNSPHNR